MIDEELGRQSLLGWSQSQVPHLKSRVLKFTSVTPKALDVAMGDYKLGSLPRIDEDTKRKKH